MLDSPQVDSFVTSSAAGVSPSWQPLLGGLLKCCTGAVVSPNEILSCSLLLFQFPTEAL